MIYTLVKDNNLKHAILNNFQPSEFNDYYTIITKTVAIKTSLCPVMCGIEPTILQILDFEFHTTRFISIFPFDDF